MPRGEGEVEGEREGVGEGEARRGEEARTVRVKHFGEELCDTAGRRGEERTVAGCYMHSSVCAAH